ncbi:tetratricopeptide repeat protein [Paraburkholderia phosphatilytica]|uniref:tetratricopeptide repeat protein n=1 Tax=Paraburkholderia phosphatilytica TaxID=2282883 RepID=UPI000E4A46EF|nr:tetratricopeptide repeat protein [Paraburkholderia phosphatilytica]
MSQSDRSTSTTAHDVRDALKTAWKLHEAGRLVEAEAMYRTILEIAPDHVDTLRSLGTLAHSANRGAEAEALLGRAIALEPANSQAHVNLADLLRAQNRWDEAEASYRHALALSPRFIEAYERLGAMLIRTGQNEEAIEVFEKLSEIAPTSYVAHQNRGVALATLKRRDEAIDAYRAALALRPESHELHSNLANMLIEGDRSEEALTHAERALELTPDFVPALVARGNALLTIGRWGEAIAPYERALALDPGDVCARNNLAVCLMNVGRHEEAASHYRRTVTGKPDNLTAHNSMQFILNYDHTRSVEDNLADAKRYGDAVMAGVTPFLHPVPDAAAMRSRRPLRVGFVSGDLNNHPIGLFMESVLANLDRDAVHPIAYVTTHREDEISARIRPTFAEWTNLLDLTPAKAAKIVHDDRIDVLVDLAGHTAKTGLPLFAWRPAPVQAHWIGFFASTGVPTMDYFIGDEYTLPPEEEHHFVEKPWRLPDGYLCFTVPTADVPLAEPPSTLGQPVTFGCFNKLSKVNDHVIAVWAKLMRRLPGSRLVLKSHELDGAWARDRMTTSFAAHGIESARLDLLGPSSRDEYFATYNRIDVALDPFPYNGGTTTVESTWMGVPVVVLRGSRFVGHMGEGILHHLGRTEWIAADEDEYIAKAIELATNPARLVALRASLRGELLASPLCDAPRFARKLEEAFAQMWAIHCDTGHADPAAFIASQFDNAVAAHTAERFDEARALYATILKLQPNHAETNENLGVLMLQTGAGIESLGYFRRALEAEPRREEFWAVYIEALRMTGHEDAAKSAWERGRQLGLELAGIQFAQPQAAAPSNQQEDELAAEFVSTLLALKQGGFDDNLLAVAKQMTEVLPEHAFGWTTLGDALVRKGRYTDARVTLAKATELAPDDTNVAVMLERLQALDEALATARELLRSNQLATGRQVLTALRQSGWNDETFNALAQAYDGTN